jgi:23S rRNA (uracil1939-C5)-methyltransferase
LEIALSGLDDEGLAVGAHEGRSVHVAGGVAGDRVLVALEHLSPHSPDAWARLERLLLPSPDRVPAACPNVGRCGGCLMQCTAYPRQLAAKDERMRRAVGTLVGELLPIVPSPRTLGYRNKAKLVFAPAPDDSLLLGSYAPRSHQVIDMAGCRVTEPPLDPIARTLGRLAAERGLRAYDERSRRGDLRYAVLRANHLGRVLAVLVTPSGEVAGLSALAEAVAAAHPELVGVVQNVNDSPGGALFGAEDHPLVGAAELADRVGSVTLELSARAFFQVNRDQAAALYAEVAREAALFGDETVIDVYAGAGGIALALAQRARRVVAIEESPVATADARRSVARAGAAHVEVVTGDARAALAGQTHADVVVVDPPRKGCSGAVLRELARLRPRTLVYVSCGPDSLARDLAALSALGLRAARCRPFDLFPHTPHVESLTVLHPAP